MEVKFDGIYASTVNEYDDTEYFRFYPDGTVIYGRGRPKPENVMRWFGRDDNESWDGRGIYTLDNDQLQFAVKTDHTTITHVATLSNSGFQSHCEWNDREADNLYRFLWIDFEQCKQANQLEVLAHTTFKAFDELPAYLREQEGAWWTLANRRGWFCKECKNLIIIGDRECYFDTGYCGQCYSEARRGLLY